MLAHVCSVRVAADDCAACALCCCRFALLHLRAEISQLSCVGLLLSDESFRVRVLLVNECWIGSHSCFLSLSWLRARQHEQLKTQAAALQEQTQAQARKQGELVSHSSLRLPLFVRVLICVSVMIPVGLFLARSWCCLLLPSAPRRLRVLSLSAAVVIGPAPKPARPCGMPSLCVRTRCSLCDFCTQTQQEQQVRTLRDALDRSEQLRAQVLFLLHSVLLLFLGFLRALASSEACCSAFACVLFLAPGHRACRFRWQVTI